MATQFQIIYTVMYPQKAKTKLDRELSDMCHLQFTVVGTECLKIYTIQAEHQTVIRKRSKYNGDNLKDVEEMITITG